MSIRKNVIARIVLLVFISILVLVLLISGVLAISIHNQDSDVSFTWWYDELNINLDEEYPHTIEYSTSEDGVLLINERRFLSYSDYRNINNFYRLEDNTSFESQSINHYYIEDTCWGCRGEETARFAAFGPTKDNISFVLKFGVALGPYAEWYIAEDFIFPDSNKDIVSSILIMKVDEIFEVYETPTFLHRVKKETATAKISDDEVINEVIKSKNYTLLNKYIEGDSQYLILAQFDDNIIYETIAVLNAESESEKTRDGSVS